MTASLVTFVDRFREAIAHAVVRTYRPVYDAAAREACGFELRRLLRRPLGAQADAIRATALSLQLNRGTNLVANMGSGKSFIAAAAAYFAGCKRVLVLCPPHLVRKWEREVVQTIPGAKVAIVRTLRDLERARSLGGTVQMVVLSREQAKLGYRWQPAVIARLARDGHAGIVRDEAGEPARLWCCPNCFAPALDDESVPLSLAELAAKKHRCKRCDSTLWQADRTGPRRFPLADQIRRRMSGHFDLLIADECFPAGTPVATPRGAVLIERLRPGEHVLSSKSGRVVVRKVVRTISRPLYEPPVRVVHETGSFVCTVRHKIWTLEAGYVHAADLGPSHTLVCLETHDADSHQVLPSLRAAVQLLAAPTPRGAHLQPEVQGSASVAGSRAEALPTEAPPTDLAGVRAELPVSEEHPTVLLEELLDVRKMGDEREAVVGGGGARSQQGGGSVGGGSGARPPDQLRSGGESTSQREKAGQGFLRTARGQRPADRAADAPGRCPQEGVDEAELDRDGRSYLDACHRGHRQPLAEDSHGVRRGLASHPQAAAPGRSEGRPADAAGLVEAPVLELGHRAATAARSNGDPGTRASVVLRVEPVELPDQLVYDLEVEDTHCYFAAGVLVSNCQEYKARGSGQGLAAGTLAEACAKTLTLTGTIFGGYASTLFHLLWRFSPAVRTEFGYSDEAKWVSRYGIVERITKKDPNAYSEDGRHSKRRSYFTRTVEKPGVAPSMLFHLLGNSVLLSLADVARDLPPYTERVALYPLERSSDPKAPSQSSCYRALAQDLGQAVRAALATGSKRLLGAYLQALLAYPDACTRGETVLDSATQTVIAHAPALPEDRLYPKERALVELVRRERARGRKVLVYITHTESRDISPRLRAILEREGFRVAVLKANTVAADRREAWIANRVQEGIDVLLTHPRLVQTGLDLVSFQSIVWLEVDYSVYVLRQASKRSWRIGQSRPVEVTFMVYEGTLQAEALALVAAKLRSSLLVEGELPEDGLAGLEGDGQDVFLELARRLTEETVGSAQSLEALFAQARSSEAEADDYLVEGEWAAEAEPQHSLAPATSAAPADGQHLPPGDFAELWQRVFAGEVEEAVDTSVPASVTADTTGRVVSFEELARLVRRPKARRRTVPEGQIALFEG